MNWLQDKVDSCGEYSEYDSEEFESKEQFEIYSLCMKIKHECVEELQHPDFGRKPHHTIKWLIDEYLPSQFSHEKMVKKVDWDWVKHASEDAS